MKNEIFFSDLGKQPYKKVWDFQEALLQMKVKEKQSQRTTTTGLNQLFEKPKHQLLFTEHPAVYTLGKNGKEAHVLINDKELLEKEIEYFHINRGGDITFHGPGQLVGYPIFDLEQFKPDLGWYLRNLEEVLILTMAEYGIKGERSPGETGVWIDTGIIGSARKIGALGIRCSRWITMHGFAFNVNTNLSYFDFIVPCGIRNKKVTSLQKELGHEVSMQEVKEKVLQNFEKVFDCTIHLTTSDLQ